MDTVDLARAMLSMGLRVNSTQHLTGLANWKVRDLYKEIFGRSPPKGHGPDYRAAFATRGSACEATLFLTLYVRAAGHPLKDVKAEEFLNSYSRYVVAVPDVLRVSQPISAEIALAVTKGLKTRQVSFEKCAVCGELSAVGDDQHIRKSCVFCRGELSNRQSGLALLRPDLAISRHLSM